MNFLNKKYSSLHTPSNHLPTSHSFLPSPSYRQKAPSLISNNCECHPNELVRHLCLQCVQLLCAECISDHLQLHREANIVPRIQSLKQVRAELEEKLDYISGLMQNNSPNSFDVEELRRKTLDKVEEMRKDVVRAVQEWVGIMRQHLLQNIGINDMAITKKEMEKLWEQVKMLRAALQGSSQAQMVRKAYKLDADMLEQGYVGMFNKYRQLQKNTDFQFSINWKEIINSLEANINIKKKQPLLQQHQEQPQEQEEEEEESENNQPILPSHARANIEYTSP